MAQETVLALLTGITGDSATRRLILATALEVSQIDKIKPATRLTSPVVRGLFPSRIEAYATLEGAAKTVTSGNANTLQYTAQPISILVPVSVGLDRSEKDFEQALIAQMAAGIARGIDRNILRASESSVYSSSLIAAAAAASNTSNAASGSAITYAEMSTVVGLVEADGYTPTGVVVRGDLKGALRNSETTGGNRFFVPSDRSETDTIFGMPVGYANTAVNPKVMETGTGKAMVVVGDFNQLDWGIYGDFDVQVNPWAYDYFTTNRVLIRAEVYMGFGILNNAGFATLLEP